VRLDGFDLPKKFVVLIPGCAPGREYKRWPAAHYAALVDRLKVAGIACVMAGTLADKDMAAIIREGSPAVIDLIGRTNLLQLAALMRESLAVVGNDTGPTHLAAALGVPTLALMSDRVNAVWAAPHGARAQALQGAPLASLGVEKVSLALQAMLDKTH